MAMAMVGARPRTSRYLYQLGDIGFIRRQSARSRVVRLPGPGPTTPASNLARELGTARGRLCMRRFEEDTRGAGAGGQGSKQTRRSRVSRPDATRCDVASREPDCDKARGKGEMKGKGKGKKTALSPSSTTRYSLPRWGDRLRLVGAGALWETLCVFDLASLSHSRRKDYASSTWRGRGSCPLAFRDSQPCSKDLSNQGDRVPGKGL